jgi:peptide deformylase
MEIKLLQENDPLLRQVCEPWDFSVDGDPTELVKAMTKIMFENNGIGLAAPQCGVSKRLFIMGNSDKLFVCINPEILYGEGENRDIEGCLSFPDLWFRVLRNTKIKVRYQNITGEIVEQEFKDLIARVYQHELDHLDGICFDTKIGPVSLSFAKQKRKKKLRHSFN